MGVGGGWGASTAVLRTTGDASALKQKNLPPPPILWSDQRFLLSLVGPDRVLAAVLAGRSRLCTDCEALTSHEKFNINVKINGRSTSAIRDTGSLVRCVRGYLVSPECHTGRTRPVGGVFQG